jgi:hypothetical protein
MFVRSPDSAWRRFQRTGDPAALARVFDGTAAELLELARHLASGEAAAEDLLQATFVTAIEDASSHDGARPVLPWLVGILGNHARVARRKARRVLDPERVAFRVPAEPGAAAQSRELRDEVEQAVSFGVLAMMNKKLLMVCAGLAGLAVLGYSGYTAFGGGAPRVSPQPPPLVGAAPPAAAERPAVAAEVERAPLVDTAAPAPPAAAIRGSLRVVVVRARDGRPAAGIGVACHPAGLFPDFAAPVRYPRTGVDGVVVFEDLGPGQVSLRLDRGGFHGARVVAGEVTEVNVTLAAGVTVSGTVSDRHSQPVAGAHIWLLDARGLGHDVARTDRAGRYECEDIADGWSLQATAAGHAPSLCHPIHGRAGGARTLDLELPAAGRRVTGMVRDANGAPVADAVVAFAPQRVVDAERIEPDRPWPRAPLWRTGPDGRFDLDQVSADAHVAVACAASRPDDAYAIATLTAGSADAFVDLQLRRGASVEGTVRSGEAPLLFATVVAWPERPAERIGYLLNLFGFEQTHTAADGTYWLSGLVPGEYRLMATKDATIAEQRVTLAAGDVLRWDPVRADSAALRLRVEPARPPQGLFAWQVLVYRRDDGGGREFVNASLTRPDGRQELSGFAPGRYDLVVLLQLEANAPSAVVVAERTDVATGPDELLIEIAAADLPSAALRGRLLDANGAPRADVKVVAVRASETLATSVETRTAADGRFALRPLPRGRYLLHAEIDGAVVALGERELSAEQVDDLGDVRAGR